MRASAMVAHYQRSLKEEKEYEAWASGGYLIPPDERRYFNHQAFGYRSLIDRGRNNDDFIRAIGEAGVRCRDCGETGDVDFHGRWLCFLCLEELKRQCGEILGKVHDS